MLDISKTERFFIIVLLIFGLFYTGLSYYKKVSHTDPAAADTEEHRVLIDLNTATPIQLEHLSGIGPVLAERIAAYREGMGGFRNIEELKNVKGIGPKSFDNIKDSITLGE